MFCCFYSSHMSTSHAISKMKINNSQSERFVCINCGQKTHKLFQRYKDVIKILHCDICGKVSDKYVEYDLVIVGLDALLLKQQAFRHILLNSGIKPIKFAHVASKIQGEFIGASHWKFGLALLVCEAITKLLQQSSAALDRKSLPDHVLYAALEVDLYWNFFRAAIELSCTLVGLIVWTKLWSPSHEKEHTPVFKDFLTALLLSSAGKILTLPAILWGPTYTFLYTMFGALFTVAANIQTTKVLCPAWDVTKVCFAVLLAHAIGIGCSQLMPPKLTLEVT